MTKRLKYTKDILTHMLNNNKPSGGGIQTLNMAGSGGGSSNTGVGGLMTSSSNRNGTINSAVSSKRSGAMGMTGGLS